MNEIQIFKNAEFGSVRTADLNGVPYFVGKDVAGILGYSNTRKALLDHVDEEDKTDGVTIRDPFFFHFPVRDLQSSRIRKSALH